MTLTLNELAAEIGGELVGGDPALPVTSVATLEEAGPGQVSFLSNPKYGRQLETTRASAVIVALNVRSDHVALLKAKDPYYALTRALVKLHGYRQHPHTGIHPAAHIDPSATIGEGALIYPGVYVGPRVRIGRDCVLHPNVVIYEDCVLGDRVTIHANSTIGVDGFGYATHKDADGLAIHHKIPQIANVVIEDDVEIGSSVCVDRGALSSTVIGKGTKLSDLIAIGHGSKIGEHGLIVALVGIAGSVSVGHHVTLAGQVGVAGHLRIGNGVTAAAQAGIIADVPDQSVIIGAPAMPAIRARRVYSIFTQLPELLDRVKQLEQQVAELSESKEGKSKDEE